MKNKNINPQTSRKIKENGAVYKELQKRCSLNQKSISSDISSIKKSDISPPHKKINSEIKKIDAMKKIHKLLKEFERVSGYPILLNTSFNVKDKTMVLTPQDAIDTFYDTDMDILVMGDYVIYK